MTDFIKVRSIDEQTRILGNYLPDDDLHSSKNEVVQDTFPLTFPITLDGESSNLRKVLVGLASQWLYFRDKVNEVYDEYDPNFTTNLIEEWEGFVGIPDSCISNTGSLEDRRNNVLLKLAGINATTANQFESIAAVFGYDAIVESGVDHITPPLRTPSLSISPTDAPFTIVVNLPASVQTNVLPLTLPFTLSSPEPEILGCLFDKLKPAHCQVLFNFLT